MTSKQDISKLSSILIKFILEILYFSSDASLAVKKFLNLKMDLMNIIAKIVISILRIVNILIIFKLTLKIIQSNFTFKC